MADPLRETWELGNEMLDYLAEQPLEQMFSDICTRGSMNGELALLVTTGLAVVPLESVEVWLGLIAGAVEHGEGGTDLWPDTRAGERAVALACVLALRQVGRRR